MTEHTPGPWQSMRSKAPHDGEYDYAIGAEGAPVLAEAFGRTADGGRPPAEANARLIAAAPDLLAQLDMVVGDLVMLRRAIAEHDPRSEIFFRIDDTLRETRAVIARATA